MQPDQKITLKCSDEGKVEIAAYDLMAHRCVATLGSSGTILAHETSANRISVFRDMFCNASDKRGNEVTVDETAAQWQLLESVVEKGPNDIPEVTDVNVLSSILSVADKYDMKWIKGTLLEAGRAIVMRAATEEKRGQIAVQLAYLASHYDREDLWKFCVRHFYSPYNPQYASSSEPPATIHTNHIKDRAASLLGGKYVRALAHALSDSASHGGGKERWREVSHRIRFDSD